MPPLTAQQAALPYDATVPLPVDPNADPDSLIPAGVALNSLAPQKGQNTQPVGNAIENVSGQQNAVDHLASKLLAGGNINIKSQEQFNALSDAQKAVIRAAASTGNINGGVQIKSSDALRIYQDAVKQARQTQVQTVMTSDGRKVDIVNGQIIPAAKQQEPVKMERWQAEDGTMMLTDTTTGRSFPAWDEKTGDSMRGQAKISEDNRVQFNQAHIELQRIQGELNQINAIPSNSKVTKDKNGRWIPLDRELTSPTTWFAGQDPGKVKDELLSDADYQSEKIRKIDPTNSVSAADGRLQPAATPSPTPTASPSPTPRPNPMPTPSQNITKAQYDALAPGSTFTWNGKTYTKK